MRIYIYYKDSTYFLNYHGIIHGLLQFKFMWGKKSAFVRQINHLLVYISQWFRNTRGLFMKLDFVLIYLNITRKTSFLLSHIGILNIDNH